LLVLQSGGPTTVINASLVGVVRGARAAGWRGVVLGARNGIEGLLAESFVDLTALDEGRLARLARTPSAALGTTRHRPDDAEIARIVAVCANRGIELVVAIGGNDTAETALRLAAAGGSRVVTVPKTIDNDLPETDHCPGYGSIARFTALAVRDTAFDTLAMRAIYPLKIVAAMGRNAGWLAASGSLLLQAPLPRPIVCLPERPWAGLEQLTQRVAAGIAADGCALLVVPETMKWAGGAPVGGDTPDWIDTFGHRYFPSPGVALARQLGAALGRRARYDKPGAIARMAMHAASEVDLAEAEACGVAAVQRGLDGASGVMVTIERISNAPYAVHYGAAPLERVANIERCLPDEFITADGHDLTPAFATYAMPLLGDPIPAYELLP
jgi:ATP-dependent phosphofructokinase / diphosphate-dependent phosphofructokinase